MNGMQIFREYDRELRLFWYYETKSCHDKDIFRPDHFISCDNRIRTGLRTESSRGEPQQSGWNRCFNAEIQLAADVS